MRARNGCRALAGPRAACESPRIPPDRPSRATEAAIGVAQTPRRRTGSAADVAQIAEQRAARAGAWCPPPSPCAGVAPVRFRAARPSGRGRAPPRAADSTAAADRTPTPSPRRARGEPPRRPRRHAQRPPPTIPGRRRHRSSGRSRSRPLPAPPAAMQRPARGR